MKRVFKAFDVNNDGYISKHEFQQVCRNCSAETNAAFKKFNKSGNGSLDYREFCEMMNHNDSRSQDSNFPNFDFSLPPSAIKYQI